MAQTDLTEIRKKVRRITRSPSAAQVSDADIDQYINTFVLYDLPMRLKPWNLRRTFTWYCEPFVDTYSTVTDDTTDQFFDFMNLYHGVYQPVYIGGYQSYYTQSRQELFQMYPQVRALQQIGQGDGVTTNFTGTLQNFPITQGSVLFDSVGSLGEGIAVADDGNSSLVVKLPAPAGAVVGGINYVTGAYAFTFSLAPASGQAVNAQTLPYVAARPQTLCYYDDTIILRPVPDQPYQINMEVDVVPTELIATNQSPEIKQWWQYLALGAAIKLFQDRMDMDSVNLIMPEFETQEMLVDRPTHNQLAQQRVPTIYVTQSIANGNWGGWGFY